MIVLPGLLPADRLRVGPSRCEVDAVDQPDQAEVED